MEFNMCSSYANSKTVPVLDYLKIYHCIIAYTSAI